MPETGRDTGDTCLMPHNPEVAGSNPALATKVRGRIRIRIRPLACSWCTAAAIDVAPSTVCLKPFNLQADPWRARRYCPERYWRDADSGRRVDAQVSDQVKHPREDTSRGCLRTPCNQICNHLGICACLPRPRGTRGNTTATSPSQRSDERTSYV